MADLYRLAYISRNTIGEDPQQIRTGVEDILAVARENNPAREITGALLYSGGHFCQVLEGPQEAIEDIFETIQLDGRHADVTVLHFEPISQRDFTEWAMALAGIDTDTRFDIEGALRSKDELRMREAGRHLVTVLDDLVRQHQTVSEEAKLKRNHP